MSEAKKNIIGVLGGVVGTAVLFTLVLMLAGKGDEPVSRPQPILAQQPKPVPPKPAPIQAQPQPLLAEEPPADPLKSLVALGFACLLFILPAVWSVIPYKECGTTVKYERFGDGWTKFKGRGGECRRRCRIWAIGWHWVNESKRGYDYRLFCPDCWRIEKPRREAERIAAGIAADKRKRELKEKATRYAKPDADTISSIRTQFARLRGVWTSAEASAHLNEYLRQYGPNIPTDILEGIAGLTVVWTMDETGFQADELFGGRYHATGHEKASLNVDFITKKAREYLEMAAACRG